MTVSSRSSFAWYARRPYAMALSTTTLAGLVGLALLPFTREFPAIPISLLFAAVMVSAWFGRVRHGLLAALLASLFANYYLSPLFRHFQMGWSELARTGLWLALTGGAAFVLCRFRRSKGEALKVLAAIAEGFCVLDSGWNFAYINACGANLLTASKKKLVGLNLWDTFPELRGTLFEQECRRCAREHVAVQFEHFSPGLERVFQIRAHPGPDGISVFYQDISASKQKEAKLRAIVERLVSAHRAAKMGIWEWNIETGEVFWSSEVPGLLALPPEEFDGTLATCLKTVHPEDVPQVRARVRAALKNKQDYHNEFRVVHPNGETHWVCCQGQVIKNSQDRAARMIGITSDITERRREEEAQRRSEKLAAAGRLAATLAHEMNNPLEALTNLLYLTRQDAGIKKETQALLRLADEQLSRVNYIAKQTLGFYGELAAQTVDVVEAMEETLAMYQSRICGKHVSIEKRYEIDGIVRALAGELRQSLATLLANAVDATPTGGKLILRIQRDTLHDAERTAAVRIEVEDSGPGIPQADQPHIFEPFFSTKSYVGTGLGLWIAKQLTQKRGGRIEFRCGREPGKSGTCFSLVLPAGNSLIPTYRTGDRPFASETGYPAGTAQA